MANTNITFNDPGGALSGVPLLATTIRAAIDYLDRYVVFRGTLDINVMVENTSTGRFAGNGDIVQNGTRNGLDLYESSAVAESRTGVDPHPGTPDLTIFIDPKSSYLAGLWWDPAIGTSLAGRVPTDKTDAFSVVLHELLHGMGVVGWRDFQTAALPAGATYESTWDAWVRVASGRATFNGPATLALLGQPAEVMVGGSQGAFHLGNGPDPTASQEPWIEASNLNGYHFFLGERYTLGRLELALLQDLGWSLKPTTLTDVVNRWDDRVAPRYIVGWDTDEQLSGDSLADRIEGRGGNDTLYGGGGNDVLDGGSGRDTVLLNGTRAQYTLRTATGGYTLSGPDGSDTLVGIERLAFADRGLALDLDGNAGTTARLIGAVFGAAQLSNRAYVGIGLSLLDGGQTPLQVAQLAIEARLGAGASSTDIVQLLYTNVVGTKPGPADLAYYTGLLDNHSATPASLTLMAANTDLTAADINLAGLLSTGLEYTGA